MKPYAAPLLALVLVACQGQSTSGPAPTATAEAKQEPQAQKSGKKFGAPLGAGAVVGLADVVARPTEFAGKTIKTEGEVKSVCQAAGCWMEIESDAGRAHVKMANHSFFMPKDCAGKRAIVEGTVQAGPPKNECGQKDSCGGEDNGAVAKLELVATGVELLD